MLPPARIGRYEIQRPLGGGPDGVCLAHDDLGRPAAVRFFPAARGKPEPLGLERAAVSPPRLSHPGIARIIDAGEISSLIYVVTEYVDGETLQQIIERRAAVPMEDRLRWIDEICDALGFAHRMGVVHLGLAPSRIVIDPAGRAIVIGFELAVVPDLRAALGPVPGYAAPELARGEPGEVRSDVFSIGAVAFAILTGEPPFAGSTDEEITEQVLAGEARRADAVNREVPWDLAAAVERAMARKPSDRFATVDDCREGLARARSRPPLLDEIVSAARGERPLEQVQFTVYRPKAVRPGVWRPMLVFTHLADLPPDAPEGARAPIEQVRDEARRALGGAIDAFRDTTADARQDVPREGEITLVPSIAGIEFNPDRRTFRWVEDVQQERFLLRAGAPLDGRVARGRLSAYLGVVLLAEVDLAIRVDASAPEPSADDAHEFTSARAYRKIFASYSHRDAEIVRQFEAFAATLGDRYLRDVRDLRAGEEWSPALLRLIDRADVFQLFWSWNALRSPHVRREWEYALSLRRPTFVRPTYWEDPLPASAAEGLPPKTLSELEFQRISVTGTSAAATGGEDVPTIPRAPRIVLSPVRDVLADPEEVARLRAASLEGVLRRARRLVADGQFDQALEACQTALSVEPGCAEALDLRHQIHATVERRRQPPRAAPAAGEGRPLRSDRSSPPPAPPIRPAGDADPYTPASARRRFPWWLVAALLAAALIAWLLLD